MRTINLDEADARVADLDAHPECRLLEGLDVLADTWLPDTARSSRTVS